MDKYTPKSLFFRFPSLQEVGIACSHKLGEPPFPPLPLQPNLTQEA